MTPLKSMRQPARISIASAAAVLCSLSPGAARATGLVAGATFPEQIVQEITALQQYVTEAQQLVAQTQMEINSVKNLATMPLQSWSSIMGTVDQVIQLQGQIRGLSWAAQNSFNQVAQQYGDPSKVMPNYGTTLAQWQQNMNDQVAATLQQYGLESRHFQTEQDALQAVQNASQSASGRMQVLQAANQIAGMQVNQLQLMRQDIMAGNTAVEQYLANRSNESQQDRNAQNQWLKAPYVPIS